MGSKYRIVECDNLYKTWFEVEKKGWFGWHKKCIIKYMPFCIAWWPFGISIKFNTYEDARACIMKKMPKQPESKAPIKRRVYEPFYSDFFVFNEKRDDKASAEEEIHKALLTRGFNGKYKFDTEQEAKVFFDKLKDGFEKLPDWLKPTNPLNK